MGTVVQTTKYFIIRMKNFTIEHDLASLHMPCREELMWSQKEKKGWKKNDSFMIQLTHWVLEQSHHWPRNSSSESSIPLIEG